VRRVGHSRRARSSRRCPVIGVLALGREKEFERLLHAFLAGMMERGYEDGKNVRFEIRYGEENQQRLTRYARELAAAKVDLIWVPGTAAAQAAHEATVAIQQFLSCLRSSRTRCTPDQVPKTWRDRRAAR